jgi:hypothetical protein
MCLAWKISIIDCHEINRKGAVLKNKRMTTSASLSEGPIFYFYAFTFMLSQSIPSFSLFWQASCGEERSRHIYPVEYEWA